FGITPEMSERDAMVFKDDGEGVLLAFGTITPGTSKVFEGSLLAREGKISELILHSPGGSVNDALEMGQLIRESEFNTKVVANGYCASSCPLIFAAGVERTAHETSWIGVHQVYTPSSTFGSIQQGMDQAQRISALCQQALVDFGVDPALWIKAMETPKDQLYVLTSEELEELKLATEVEMEEA
ncbi:MAG: ATP-dependent Clp protease proteolytic subunit, partial [Hyphomicrobiales bacterium]